VSGAATTDASAIDAVVIGAAGYIGGELVRLLLGHPRVRLRAASSRTFAGQRVDGVHPNLRGATDLVFTPEEEAPACDVLFLAAGHGRSVELLRRHGENARIVVDLGGDLRIVDPEAHRRAYPDDDRPEGLARSFTAGWPEARRDALRASDRISVPGCMAMAAILALHPLAAAGAVEPDVTVDARTGSSGAGATAGDHNLHAERSGAMRVFAPRGHRHEGEIAQATGLRVRMTATGVEAVRGVQVLCRARAREPVDERAVRAIYREAYQREPFVRVVAQKRGIYRYPEPKILLGSNYCDVGFAVSDDGRDVVAIAALDNLMKGGAGNAVQCVNIRMGWPERLGLEFAGLHPL